MSIKTKPTGMNSFERRKTKRARKERTLSSESSNDGQTDQASMLAALQAHSRIMLGLSSDDQPESSTMAQKRHTASLTSQEGSIESDLDEDNDEDEEDFQSDDGWGAEDGMVSDSEDEFISTGVTVPEVVFDQSSFGRTSMISLSEKRAFLNGNSAKLMGLKPQTPSLSKSKIPSTDDQEEANNISLDRTLHSLLINSLLPSHNSANSSRPVEKRNLLHSRLQQLSELPSPSSASSRSSSPSMNNPNKQNHSAKIKTGIMQKAHKRELKQREESKFAGSYHSSLGGLSDLGKGKNGLMGKNEMRRKEKEERMGLGEVKRKKGMDGKDLRRERGLGNGIGKFEGGMLKLSKGEIARAEGRDRGGGGGGRGGRDGGKRGGGGKRKRQ